MKSKGEYQPNKTRDLIVFAASTALMLFLYFFATEWIWVAFPFQFTALAGFLGRL